jgi:hypothetical protein
MISDDDDVDILLFNDECSQNASQKERLSRNIQKGSFIVRRGFLRSRFVCDAKGCLKELYGGRKAPVTSGDTKQFLKTTTRQS